MEQYKIKKLQQYIKDKVFEECRKMYEAGLESCEPISHDRGEKKHQEAYDNIIYRLQDYDTITYDEPIDDLSFDDYKNVDTSIDEETLDELAKESSESYGLFQNLKEVLTCMYIAGFKAGYCKAKEE